MLLRLVGSADELVSFSSPNNGDLLWFQISDINTKMETINANIAFVPDAIENLVSCFRMIPLFLFYFEQLLELAMNELYYLFHYPLSLGDKD